MSVETRVMADGRWTTRTLNIHQILERNREEKREKQNLTMGPKPPVVGLFTRTLVGSPIVKAIIPARVRHRSKNDVIFVYEDSIVIKEVLGGERTEEDPFRDISLDDPITKEDFDSSIQGAKVIGLPREPKVPRFPGRFWSQDYKPQSPLETKPEPFKENEIPPQILVLSLTSRALVFLFAYYDIHDMVQFVSTSKPLPAHIPLIEELGVHMAVDPKSRAMAVGAYENRIVIYALKTRERLESEVQEPDGLNAAKFMPIQEEKHAVVDGFILKMEFLHPAKEDEYHVILLLVVSKAQKTRLVRIEWDCRSSLDEVNHKPGQVLPYPERLPLLLIPLTYRTAFALVCEDRIIVYKDILTGVAHGQSCDLEHYEPPEEPGSSKRLPIWTQWARPMRPLDRRHPNIDNIYLCREDGVVRYIDIREDSISSNYNAGILNANVGSAFATLDLGEESNDLLVAGGEMGDGGLWYFKPRGPLELIGIIRNWTPLKDLINTKPLLPATKSNLDDGTKFPVPGRFFACGGRGPRNGAIVEIRIGVEAVKLGPTIDLGELVERGIENIWALPDRSNIGVYLMVGRPMDTQLILLPSANDQDPQVAKDVEELDLEVRTIAVGSTAEGFIIQVTQASINAIAQEHGILPFTSKLTDAVITAACFLTIPTRATVLVTVVRKGDEFYLHHGYFGSQNNKINFAELGEPILLRSEASALSLQWIQDRIVAFVGTLAGTLQSYMADPGSSFAPYFEYSFDKDTGLCDSLAMITVEKDKDMNAKHVLVCGLRNGTVETLIFRANSFDEALSLCERIGIGITSVKVLADSTRGSRAILSCDQQLYTFEYLQDPLPTNPATVNRVWLTDPANPAFWQRPLDCFTQASSRIPYECSKFGAGSLFYLAGDRLMLADLSLSTQPEMVPRRIPFNGTPSRVSYSDRLKKLIVICTNTTVAGPTASQRARTQNRTLNRGLAFVDPNSEILRSELDKKIDLKVREVADPRTGERFLGVMEWYLTDGHRRYHLLVINSIIRQAADEEATGRLLLLAPAIGDDGEVFTILKRSMDRRAPVWCVASYGDSSLIYACGEELILQPLDMGARTKFGQEVAVTLRCPASHISVQGTDIHVSTKGSGHHIFHVEDNKLVPVCAEASGRSSVHHLTIPEKSLVLTSDRECRVAGLWQPPQPQLNRTAPLVFEATRPCSITRFCKIAWPTWEWRSSRLRVEVIIGTSEDGGLHQLTLLSEPEWRLLAFIQNMAMRNTMVCPYPYPLVHERKIEPSLAKKQDMHINGDVLDRLVERGGATLLKKMLEKESDVEFRSSDYETAKYRGERFGELFTEIFKAPAADDSVERTLEWIQRLLLPAI